MDENMHTFTLDFGVLRFQAIVPFKIRNANDTHGNYSWQWRAGQKKAAARAMLDLHVSYAIGYDKEKPVNMMVTRILGPRQQLYDADSVARGNCKQLIDAFVQAGYLHDDGPAYIQNFYANQLDGHRDVGPKAAIISLYQ